MLFSRPLFSTGGTSDPITIYTDGTVVVTTPDDWIIVNHESSTLFTVTATRNKGSERSGTVVISLSDLVEGTISLSIKINQEGRELVNGHEYVDLGLSVMWATCNIGASKPEEYGDYYAWGDTATYYESGYTQSFSLVWKTGKSAGYTWKNYKYGNGSLGTLTKYCNNSSAGNNGFTDTLTILLPEDDVAHVKWGGSWRMPTKFDFEELKAKCNWQETTQNGVPGWKVTSRKDTSRFIFLPTAGYRDCTRLNSVGSFGGYWSSSLATSTPYNAYGLNLSIYENVDYSSRTNGQSVRPVCP